MRQRYTTATRSMNQPANAAREKKKGKGKGRGISPGAKTVNRTHGAARPGGHHNPYPLFRIFKKVRQENVAGNPGSRLFHTRRERDCAT
ncbi:unnamed protein product, partial [Ascophyllum nodosum]